MAEKALKEASGILETRENTNIVEIGTGSGAIAISLYMEIAGSYSGKKNGIRMTATNISSKAIDIARKNAGDILTVDKEAIEFISCDILPDESSSWFSDNRGNVDIIVSNPPYISKPGFGNLPGR